MVCTGLGLCFPGSAGAYRSSAVGFMSHITIIMLSIITITAAAVLAVVSTLVVIMVAVLAADITAAVLAVGIIDILQGNGEPPNTIVGRLA